MKRKVIHVFPSESWGGAEIYVFELASEQKKSGVEVFVWCVEGSRLYLECQKHQIPTLVLDLPKGFPWDFSKRLANQIRSLFSVEGRTEQALILHLHWTKGVKSFFGIKKWMQVKIVLHVHMWVKHSKKDILSRWAFRAVDHVVVAGPRARSAVVDHLPIENSRVVEIPYAIQFKNLPIDSRNQIRNELNIPFRAFVFGLFARMDRQKGVREFLNALQPLMEKDSNIYAVVVGDPTHGEKDALDYSKEITDFIKNSPHRNRISHLPFRPEFLPLLSACDILVAPSYHESYALIFLHAFSLGISAISTNSGGTPDLVKAQFGWLVPPRDVDELSKQMAIAFHHPEDVRRKGIAAQEFTLAHHNFKQIIEQWNLLYDR